MGNSEINAVKNIYSRTPCKTSTYNIVKQGIELEKQKNEQKWDGKYLCKWKKKRLVVQSIILYQKSFI